MVDDVSPFVALPPVRARYCQIIFRCVVNRKNNLVLFPTRPNLNFSGNVEVFNQIAIRNSTSSSLLAPGVTGTVLSGSVLVTSISDGDLQRYSQRLMLTCLHILCFTQSVIMWTSSALASSFGLDGFL